MFKARSQLVHAYLEMGGNGSLCRRVPYSPVNLGMLSLFFFFFFFWAVALNKWLHWINLPGKLLCFGCVASTFKCMRVCLYFFFIYILARDSRNITSLREWARIATFWILISSHHSQQYVTKTPRDCRFLHRRALLLFNNDGNNRDLTPLSVHAGSLRNLVPLSPRACLETTGL